MRSESFPERLVLHVDEFVMEATASRQSAHKKCTWCSVQTTPLWRMGPSGAGTLCNACGIRHARKKDTKSRDASEQSHVKKKLAL